MLTSVHLNKFLVKTFSVIFYVTTLRRTTEPPGSEGYTLVMNAGVTDGGPIGGGVSPKRCRLLGEIGIGELGVTDGGSSIGGGVSPKRCRLLG